MHDALSQSVWSAVVAVARLSRARMHDDWADREEVSEAELEEPALFADGRAWLAKMNASWGAPEAREFVKQLPPLVWVRWAINHCDAEVRRRLEITVARWNFAQVCSGQFAVMRKNSKGPNLSRFGLVGHGLPIQEFMLSEPFDPSDQWSMVLKTRDGGRVGPRKKEELPARVVVPGKRGRGRGIEQAVRSAVERFFEKDERLQEVLPRPASGPRFRMQNMTRTELVVALKRGHEGLRRYGDASVVAELSSLVAFPRGRPVHR